MDDELRAQVSELEGIFERVEAASVREFQRAVGSHLPAVTNDPQIAKEELWLLTRSVFGPGCDTVRRDLRGALDRVQCEGLCAIDEIPETGRVNWTAVRAVAALRALWERRMGKPAPRNYREGSAFTMFALAGFEYLNLKADLRSAFNAWKRRADDIDGTIAST